MTKAWKYIEPVVGLTCALIGVPAAAIVGAVNGAKLIAAVKENWDGSSLDFEMLASSMRMAALRTADRFDFDQAARDALTEADAAMADHLVSCLPTREELVGLAHKGNLATTVASHVVDRLSAHDPRFAQGAPSVAGFNARSFAAAVVQSVIEAALANNDYRQSLITYLQIETLQGVVRLEDGQAEDRARDVAFQNEQRLAVAAILSRLGNSGDAETLDRISVEVAKAIANNPDQGSAELVEQVVFLIKSRQEALEKLEATPIEDNRVRSFQAAAEQALGNDDDAAAIVALLEAEAAIGERQEIDARARANYTSIRAGLLLGQGDWQAADAAWEQAAAMLMPFDLAAGEDIVWEAANHLYDFGRKFGQSLALVACDQRCRALEIAATLRGDSERAAMIHNMLGIALLEQSEQKAGQAAVVLLAEAYTAFQAVLTVRTQVDKPADWAGTQNNLGNVLLAQGRRTVGEAGLALLGLSVDAYQQALTVYTQAAMPVDWAMTQNNLGIVLQVQGTRTEGEAGLALLGRAVDAHRAALIFYTQAAMPADWAMTQNNLGNVLRVQGRRTLGEAGFVLLGQSVDAYQQALSIYTQAAMPADWAMTQNNLGVVLRLQGERTRREVGLVLLGQSVDAHRAALTFYTQATMPAHWAGTQNNLGNVLRTQGERTGGDAGGDLLAQAVEAFRAALTIWTLEHFSYYHEMASYNLAQTEAAIAARRG